MISSALILLSLIYLSPYILFSSTSNMVKFNAKSELELDQYLREITSKEMPPAIDVTILKKGKEIYSKAFGLANGITGEKISKSHVYHLWSMTKTFTAVAIFQLIEKGFLKINDPINKYLVHFRPVDFEKKSIEITIGQLLNHTSGLKDFDINMLKWTHKVNEPYYGDSKMVKERLINYQELNHKPGSVSKYGNINYVLLGAIIESITKNTYENYIREFILKPMKMNGTGFIYRKDMNKYIAKGTLHSHHFWNFLIKFMGPKDGFNLISDRLVNKRYWLEEIYTDYSASTSLIGTGEDTARFAQMLLNGGEIDGVKILSNESTQAILYKGRINSQRKEVLNNKRKLALGFGTKTWFEQGHELIGHGGGGPGFAVQYLIIPKKDLVIVVLTNQSLMLQFDLAKDIAFVF